MYLVYSTCRLGATTEARRQNTEAQAVVHHGRSASGVDEFGDSTEIRGDLINSGHSYRRAWVPRRKN